MKKNRKRIWLIVAVILAAALIVAGISFYPMLIMRPAETGAIPGTNIFAVQNGRNAVYFVDTGEGFIMIDAGSDANALQAGMAANGIGVGDVKWILLTHTDYDHVAALPLFPEAQVYMSETELRDTADKSNFPIGTDNIHPLTDGQEVTLGGVTVKGISAPGHSGGSAVAHGAQVLVFYQGDAFRLEGAEIFVHPFSADGDAAQQSIEKLKDIMHDCELILTGHYGYF